MVKLFFGNRSFSLLILPIFLVGYLLCNYYSSFYTQDVTSNFGMWGNIKLPNHWGFQAGSASLIFISSLLLNSIFNRNEFMERNSYLIPLLYITVMSFFHFFYFLEGLSIAQMFLVITVFQLFKLNQNDDGRRIVFNASFFFGLACTFYPVLFIGVPFLFWMVWVMRPFILRESALIVDGFMVPLLYSGAYSFVFKTRLDRTAFSSSSSQYDWINIIVVSLGLLLLIGFSLKGLFGKIATSSIRMKKIFRLLLLLILLCLIAMFIDYFVFHKLDEGAIIMICLVFVIPYGFGQKSLNKIPTVIYYLILFYSVSKFFIPYGAITF